MLPEPGFEKWIGGINPDDQVLDVASRSLAEWLSAVTYNLPLAAQLAHEDISHVHALRVSTRRSIAALRLFSDFLPVKQNRTVQKQLKKIRTAAGAARDLDVMALRYDRDRDQQAERFRDDIRLRRSKAQRPIRKIAKQLGKDDKFQRQVDKLLRRIRYRGGKKKQQFGTWAKAHLKTFFRKFQKAQPVDSNDLIALHRYRIRGKQLRYAMELLAPAFGPEFRQQLYPVVEQLQERLGEINDHAVALARLNKWQDEMRGQDAHYFRQLLIDEQAQLEQSLEAFWKWWTEQRQQDLAQGFNSVLSG